MIRYILPVEVQALEEGGYLALCPVLQGCHAQGDTVSEALDNLMDVARILLELRVEDGLPIPEALKEAKEGDVLHGEVLVTLSPE